MLEGRADPEGLPWHDGRQGGSRGFTMVCWKAGRIQRVYHGMMEGRADPEGLPWYDGRQGRMQRVYHGMLKGRGGSRGSTMV